jgi:hypothetical protein
MNPQTIVIAVSALLLAWYIAAHLYNRRRGRRLRRWVEARLTALGGEREAGWIGSPASGARFNVRRADPPFRRLEATLLLANREIPLLWLVDHLRGRRDRIIIRGTLRSPRRGEVWVTSSRRSDRRGEDWTWQEGPHGLQIAFRGRNGRQLVTTLSPWLEAYGAHLDRFHWQKQDPHINLQLIIVGLLDTKSQAFLTDLVTALQANGQA